MLRRDLKSSIQCTTAYNKASAMLGLINRTIQFKDKYVLTNLYKSIVRPSVEYCISAWSPHFNKDKVLIERIQHRFTRMIPGMKELTYENRLRKLKLWSLEERRNRTDLLEVYKMFHGLSELPIEKFFDVDRLGKTRGHSLKISKKFSNMDVRKYFFSERVVNRWNLLSEDCVTAQSINAFKQKLNKVREIMMGFFMD